MDRARFPEIVRELYRVVDELETMFPGRHFTPDGHMVGSIGEALAAHYYGVTLLKSSHECHDGTCGDRQVQVKATQGDRVALSSKPDYLLVLRLGRDGSFTEEYNGAGGRVWDQCANRARPKNGQYPVSLATLRRLTGQVGPSERIERREP